MHRTIPESLRQIDAESPESKCNPVMTALSAAPTPTLRNIIAASSCERLPMTYPPPDVSTHPMSRSVERQSCILLFGIPSARASSLTPTGLPDLERYSSIMIDLSTDLFIRSTPNCPSFGIPNAFRIFYARNYTTEYINCQLEVITILLILFCAYRTITVTRLTPTSQTRR